MSYIRVLYGSDFSETRPKILKDLDNSFDSNKPEFWRHFVRKTIVYYTLGIQATNLLHSLGALHIRQCGNEPLPVESGGVWSWNKMYLMRLALEDSPDIIYTDFDVKILKPFDPDDVLNVVRSHDGLGRILQMPQIRYKKHNHYWWRSVSGDGWNRISPRIGMFGCFIYVSSSRLMDLFLKDYEELSQEKKVGDEHTITYSIDKRFGEMTQQQLYDNFDPVVMTTRRSLVKSLGVTKPDAVFSHKH